MTTPSDDELEGSPYLPLAAPTLKVTQPVTSAESVPQPSHEMSTLPSDPSVVAPGAAEPATFDAKAMVESQKHVVQNPAYGGLPTSTPESVAAAKALRSKAHRKRQRNQVVGWFVALAMLGGIAAAGWFAYQAYQDDQDQLDADREAAQADGSAGAPGALTPLGNQTQVIEAIEDVNSGATTGAGGLLGAVDDAQAAVDDINDTPTAEDSPAVGVLSLQDVRPDAVVRLGTLLDNADGYERHIVDPRQFAADSPTEYSRFLAVMRAQPQADPGGAAFVVLPATGSGEIGFALIRDGDKVIRAVIASADLDLYVDYAP